MQCDRVSVGSSAIVRPSGAMASASVAGKRSLSADRQQTHGAASATDHRHHDNQQVRPISSPALSSLELTPPSSVSSLSRKCPRLDVLQAANGTVAAHHYQALHQSQQQQQPDSTHKCAGTQT